MVNDGYSLSNLQSRYPHLRIIEIEGNNTISGNRAIGINYAIQNSYDTIFLCDVDDYMTPNRVDVSIAALSDADIVVNDLDIVDANRNLIFKDYFQKTIKSETILDSKFIESKNIFGFSNTALRVSKLEEVKFPSDLRIVDWYYFTQLLNDGLKAKFIPQSLTEYRQHSGNMIGISSFTLDGFKNLLKLKIRHYSYFKDTYHGYSDELSEMLEIAEKSNEQLKEIIKKNTSETPISIMVAKCEIINLYNMKKYPYIVAEIGGNHNGDIELGKQMIKAAKECGADAVKFQLYRRCDLWTEDHLKELNEGVVNWRMCLNGSQRNWGLTTYSNR